MKADNVYLKWLSLVVIGISLFIFYRAFTFEFLNYDDPLILTRNRTVVGYDFKSIFTKLVAADYVPLTLASFALEYHFFGENPSVFHSVNIFLHIINCILVVFLFYRFSEKNFFLTVFGALIFATCPLHVESVAWITERKDVLYGMFFLLSLISYLRYLDGKRSNYFMSLVFFALSLLSKSMAVTLPIVLFLLDFLKNRKLKIIEKIPFIVMAVWLALIQLGVRAQTMKEPPSFKPLLAMENVLRSLIFYTSKFIWPNNLTAFYESEFVKNSVFEKFMALIFVGVLVFAAKKFEPKNRRCIYFGLLFFLICISPVLQIVPYGNGFIYGDRYFYIPGIGLIFALGVLVNSLVAEKSRSLRPVIYVLPFIILYGVISHQRTNIWANSEILWKDVINKYPESNYALNSLGHHYMSSGQIERAIDLYENQKLKDPHQVIYINLGNAYLDTFQPSEAIRAFQKAATKGPPFADAYVGLGNAYSQSGNRSMALIEYEKSLKIKPKCSECYYNLGLLFKKSGDFRQAKTYFEKSYAINPYDEAVLGQINDIKKFLMNASK